MVTEAARDLLETDQAVVYIRRSDGLLEPAFAKAPVKPSGDGADLSWGYSVAKKSVDHRKTVRKSSLKNQNSNARVSVSLPLRYLGVPLGALVLIRHNGPPFNSDEMKVAELLTSQLAQLITLSQQQNQIAKFEEKQRISLVQDDFVALISHELLSPLGFIKGYTTTLLRDDVHWEKEKQHEFLEIINDEADRLHVLIEEILDSSRFQSGNNQMRFQPLDIEKFIRGISERVRTRYEKVNYTLDLCCTGELVMGDETRLAQVMDNLFSNVSKYAPGAPVTIRLSQIDQKVCISFIDAGPGISEQDLSGMFQRFYRVPKSRHQARGSGLGLFISREIIRAHQGEMTVESSLGKGTIFHIFLPIFYKGEVNI